MDHPRTPSIDHPMDPSMDYPFPKVSFKELHKNEAKRGEMVRNDHMDDAEEKAREWQNITIIMRSCHLQKANYPNLIDIFKFRMTTY